MASPDRILQLKLVSDTKGVSQDLSKTTKSLTRIQKAQGKMQAGWKRMGPAIKTGFTMALDVGVDLLQRGFAEMEEGEKVARDLERVLEGLGKNSARNLKLISDAAENALDLNFDDEDFKRSVGLVEQHFKFSIPRAIDTVNAAMDVAAQRFDGDLPRALNVVEGALRGKKKAFEALGIPMRLLGDKAKTLRWILHHFAGAAADDANTITGRWESAQKRFDNTLGDIVTSLRDGLVELVDTADEMAPQFDAAINVLPGVVATATSRIHNRLAASAVTTGIDALAIAQAMFDNITGKTSKIAGAVGGDLDAITTVLHDRQEPIRTAAEGIGDAIRDPIVERVGQVTTRTNAMVNNVLDALTVLKGRLQAMRIPVIGGILGDTFGPPGMAEGGIVTRPTLAVIGERGPEAVVPLGSGGGMPWGGVVVNITTGVGDPVEIGRQVDRVLRAYRGRAGIAA